MIYIDPPYNTGNDFVYHDDFHRTQAEEDLEAGNVDELGNRFVKNTETNGKFHSDWCSMIYPRLQLAHSLLSEDGVIFISIDDNELVNLKKITDEIFGERNFIDIFNWAKTETPENLSKKSKQIIEYVLCYQKNASDTKFKGIKKEAVSSNGLLNQPNKFHELVFPANKVRTSIKNGIIKAGDYGTESYKVQLVEDTEVKNGMFIRPVKLAAKFKWSQTNLDEELKKETIIRIPTMKFSPSYEKKEYDAEVPANLINSKVGVFTNEQAGSYQETLFGKKVFNFPKPTSLIEYLFGFNENEEDDVTVLDFFSGSATTADAVMRMNAKRGYNKFHYILVQIQEDLNEAFVNAKTNSAKQIIQNSIDFCKEHGFSENICSVAEERIRRAGKKIKEELQGAALVAVRNGKSSQGDLFDQGNQQTDGHEGRTLQADDLDTGFRVFRVDSSNMKDVYFAPKDLEPQQLDLFADNVKEDRTELDLLYGCMVDWGVPLSLPLSEETIDVADGHTMATDDGTIADGHKGRTLQADGNGVTVYTVNDGDLVACFGKPITDNVVKAMADKAPLRVLFRDSCFEKDEQKINIFEQFKQLLGWSDDEALNNIRVI